LSWEFIGVCPVLEEALTVENSNIDYNVQGNHYQHFRGHFSEAQAKK